MGLKDKREFNCLKLYEISMARSSNPSDAAHGALIASTYGRCENGASVKLRVIVGCWLDKVLISTISSGSLPG